MKKPLSHRHSRLVTVFHDRRLPEPGRPVGYAALIDAYGLEVPLPRQLHAIGERHKVISSGAWRLLTPRHAPDPTLAAHLTFALKREGVDLLVLKRLFLAVDAEERNLSTTLRHSISLFSEQFLLSLMPRVG